MTTGRLKIWNDLENEWEILGPPSGSGGAQPEPTLTTLTADDLYDLANTPVELVPAPGANTVLMPDNILYHYKPGATPFAGQLGMRWQWGDDSFDSADQTSISLAVTGGEHVALHFPGVDVDNVSGDPADITDQPLMAVAYPVPALTGPILTSSLADGGTDYAPGDTGTIGGNMGGTGATYIVDTVSGGVVTGYTLTALGGGYHVGESGGGSLLTGIGSGLFITVDTITPGTPGDGTVEVTVVYKTITLTLA